MPESLLDESIIQQLKEMFTEMIHPLDLLVFGSQHNTEVSSYLQQLLEEVSAASDLIRVSLQDMDADAALAEQYHVDKAPGVAILGRQPDGSRVDFGVRFAGFPGNYEFTSLITALMRVSRRESGLADETKAALAGLKKPVHLMVFVTPT